jgi:Protein of unknown function (DUF2878).
MNKTLIFNVISFQVLWFACVQGSWSLALAAITIFMLLHLRFVQKHAAEYLHALLFTALGFVLETAINSLDFIHYANSATIGNNGLRFAPFWLVCLWLGFSTTFFHSFTWLQTRPVMRTLLILVALPISYELGARFSGSTFPQSKPIGLIVVTLVWVLAFNLGFYWVNYLQRITNARRSYV